MTVNGTRHLYDKRDKEIHFFFNRWQWETAGGFTVYTTAYDETLRTIERGSYKIATTQVALLSTRFWDEYALYIHDNTGIYRIKEGMCEHSKIQLRRNTNLLKAWIEGKLGYDYGRTGDSRKDAQGCQEESSSQREIVTDL